jgi:hypothetical protein
MKIEDFYAYPKKVTIMGNEVEIYPITAKYFPLILKARMSNDIDMRISATTELAFITLKQIFPTATKDDFDKLSSQALNEIMTVFWEVNSDQEEEEAKKILLEQVEKDKMDKKDSKE